jgi:prepilin-type N-terminal cleavage/methylation domain-containing protein
MRQRIKDTEFRKPLHGFTLVELLVVIAIIALLLSILMPALSKARENARNLICASNTKSIATAILTYAAGFNDIMPVQSEAPTSDAVVGNRMLPLILRDQKFLPISSSGGGVWRCPRDIRVYKPHFLAYYYYWGPGAIGNSNDCPYNGMFMSYSSNSVYRVGSSKCPWSYYAPGGSFVTRRLTSVKNPQAKVMFFDSGNTWDISAPDPFTLFYTWITVERRTAASILSIEQWWRHKPKNFGPFGNMGFLDGHLETNIDYLTTCGKRSNAGRWISDSAIAARWWSVDGSR